MTNYYVSSVAYAAIAQWAALTTYSVGQYVRQLAAPGQNNERVFKATAITTGISGASEPTWNKNDNATTTDAGVTWTQIGGHESEQQAGNWRAAAARISTMVAGVTNADTIFVSSDHDEQWTSDPGYNMAANIISVSRGGVSLPPTSADIAAGAIAEGITNAMTFTAGFQSYVYGITFQVGGGSNNGSLQMRGRGGQTLFDTCKLILTNTNASAKITLGTGEINGPFRTLFHKPTIKFGSTSQQLFFGADDVLIDCEGAALIDAGGSMPTRLIGNGSGVSNKTTIVRTDLSNFSGTNLFASGSLNWNTRGLDFIDCKMPAGFTTLPNTQPLAAATHVRFWNCDDGNRTYRFYEQVRGGIMQSTENAGRVGGANDGVTALCWQFQAEGNGSFWQFPYTSPPISVRVTATGSAKTATLNLCSSTALTNANTWLTLSTLDDSSDTLGATHTTKSADFLAAGSGLSTTTEDWTANTAARQNSHAYALGDTYKSSNNAGRLFIVTLAGTSAGSEPGGIATAVDGGTVTDGTAVVTAAYRYKMAVTWTPQRPGVMRGYFNSALANSTPYMFVDPKLVIT